MKFYWIFTIFVLGLPFFSQSSLTINDLESDDTTSVSTEISSLQKIIIQETRAKEIHDTIIVNYYLQLSDLASENNDFISAIDYCDTIIDNYTNIPFFKLMEAQEKRAFTNKSFGQTETAVAQLLNILSQYEDHGAFEKSATLNKKIGVIFLKMGELESAEYHLKESIEHARKINNKKIEAGSLMSLGNRYKNDNKLDEAEKCYKESIAICKKEGYKKILAGSYNNIGSLYRKKNNLDQAVRYYNLAVKINKEIGNEKWLSYNYNNLGNIHNNRKQYQKALEYFFLSNDIKTRIKDYGGMTVTLINISGVYDSIGNYNQAYKYYQAYSKLKDSLVEVDNVLLTKKLAAEFQAEKREAKILRLNMESEMNHQEIKARDQRISYQKFLSWLFGIGIFLVIAIAVVIWFSAANKKKANIELVKKNKQIDEQHGEIIDSINYAKRIQNSILPSDIQLAESFENYGVFYKPKDIISGDFYVCEKTRNGVLFGTVDCTGHGVPGAMVSLVASSNINKSIHELKLQSTGEVLNQLSLDVPKALNDGASELNDGMDIAICHINNNKKILQFSGGNQNCWIINSSKAINSRDLSNVNHNIYKEGEVSIIELKGQRMGIGKSYDNSDFQTNEISLMKGDKVLMSTDGFQDQFGGPSNKKFKVKQMREILLVKSHLSPNKIVAELKVALQKWQGDYDQVDDICIIIAEV